MRDERLLIIVITASVRNAEIRVTRSSAGFVWSVSICAVLSAALIAAALWFWGAQEVRGNWEEVSFLTAIGGFWLVLAGALFSWLGLSLRDDAIERKNYAAMIALCGAIFATAITFAAGNLGEGPSYWENIFCAGLATGGLFLLWSILELGGNVSASIAEERDLASGMRLSGALLAWSLILARAVTGNWHSASASVYDFLREGWVTTVICLLALLGQLLLKPSTMRPLPSWAWCGLMPAIFYLALAVAWVWQLGRWEGMPR